VGLPVLDAVDMIPQRMQKLVMSAFNSFLQFALVVTTVTLMARLHRAIVLVHRVVRDETDKSIKECLKQLDCLNAKNCTK
jgi:hypothetical protein